MFFIIFYLSQFTAAFISFILYCLVQGWESHPPPALGPGFGSSPGAAPVPIVLATIIKSRKEEPFKGSAFFLLFIILGLVDVIKLVFTYTQCRGRVGSTQGPCGLTDISQKVPNINKIRIVWRQINK